jgi:hypothetical protein
MTTAAVVQIKARRPLRQGRGADRVVGGGRRVDREQPVRTPLGAIARGLVAGALGTSAMDAFLYARYRCGGGKEGVTSWELSEQVATWEQAPAPAQVGRRVVEGLFQRKLPGERAALVNNVTHWAYGILSAASYGIFAGSLRKQRAVYGLPFGAAIWLTGYAILPAAGLYKPIWQYDALTLAKDLSAHLVYGASTGLAFAALNRRAGPLAPFPSFGSRVNKGPTSPGE